MALTLDELEEKLTHALMEIRLRDARWKNDGGTGNASVAAKDRRALLERLDECRRDVRDMRNKQTRLPGVK
jgi:hypothetical protein